MNNQLNDLEAQNSNANKKILSERQMVHELENVLAGVCESLNKSPFHQILQNSPFFFSP